MFDIVHRIGLKAKPEKVFAALSTIDGLAGWWTDDTEGDAHLGGKIAFSFWSISKVLVGRMVMQVEAETAPSEIRWLCTEGPDDWVGTSITFRLSEQDGQTIVVFGHRNWQAASEAMAHCSMKWAVFLLSLRQYMETGVGRPSPGDLKIDNWN
jgi:uncharacterized protein YndB with AHSA1/START domain